MPEKDGYHHGDLGNALLKAATDILNEDGLEALSLRAVARRAGVSQTAPYRHFKDKAALMAAVAANGFRGLRASMGRALNGGEDTDRLRVIGRAYVEFALDNAGLYRLMFGSDITKIDRDDDYWSSSRQTFDLLGEVIASAGGANAGKAEALAAWSLVHGLSMLLLDDLVDISSFSSTESLVDQVLLTRGR